MFNYEEIDKYITLKDLCLIMKWFEECDEKTNGDYMVSSIDRKDNEYIFNLTIAQHGYSKKFKIENGEVVDLGIEGFVWMS